MATDKPSPILHLRVPAGAVSEDLHDFPLLVQLADPVLRSDPGAQTAGAFVFAAADGQALEHVVEHQDQAAGDLTVWVRIPNLRSDAHTDLEVRCGGAAQGSSARAFGDDYALVLSDLSCGDGETADPVRVQRGRRAGQAMTVEAWVHSGTPQAEAMQVIAAQWAFAGSMTGFDTYDAGATDGLETRGYFGAVFDGRYVYFSPQCNSEGRHGKALRYDTHGGFDDAVSWCGYDAGSTSGLTTRGYYGAVFDGRYVYYVPRTDGQTLHSRILRYDTRGPGFAEPGSWQAHDIGQRVSYQGGAFDGRYVYFAPGYHQDTGPSGLALRYDTHGEFDDPASHAVHDAAGTDGLTCTCYDGAVFDGRYVYFAPLGGDGTVLRCDTRADFQASEAWAAQSARDLGGLDMGMCVGAVFDGRYVYFVPYANSVVVRYDTRGGFHSETSWEARDARATSGLDTRGYDGAAFDGRYVYFIPFWDGDDGGRGFHARLLRYDTSRDFADPGAWDASDGSALAPPNPGGFNGGAFDGRYLYMAPWREDCDTGDIASHGQVLRYDTAGEDACFALKYTDCGHNGGLCGAVPGPTFTVNTPSGAVSARANHNPAKGWHHLAGVYDGERIQLFVDGQAAGEGEGMGPTLASDREIAVGCFAPGLADFQGHIGHLRLSTVARSPAWLAATEANLRSPEEFVRRLTTS